MRLRSKRRRHSMSMTIRKRDKQVLRRIRRLAETDCANFSKGNCLENDTPCDVTHEQFSSIHNGVIACDYFLVAVLPTDPELCSLILYEILRVDDEAGEGWKQCVRCHKPFIPTCNRQKFCKACGEEAKLARTRLKQRRYRERKRLL